MREIVLKSITPEELYDTIRQIIEGEVAKHMAANFDHTLTTTEVAHHFGVSSQTVNRWAKQGRIKRINVAGRPMYSFNQIQKHKP